MNKIMKHNKLQLKAALLLLLSGLTLTAQATVTGTYDSTTKTLSFTGSGEITQAIVQATSTSYANATSAVIGTDVTSIGTSAFSGCTALTDLTINSATVASLTTYTAAANLTDQFPYITNLTFGANVTVVATRCFYYDGTGTYPLASVTFKGTPSIGQSTFCNNRSLATITGSVKSIADYSFYNCVKLKSISITNDTALDKQAFYNCSALSSITLPSNLTTINDYVFQNCTSLNNVVIPETVTTISKTAFSGCSKLTTVRINSATIANPSTAYTSTDNLADRFPYLKTLTYGAKVTTVGSYSFWVDHDNSESYPLTTVTFNSVPNIYERAFTGNTSLSTISGKVGSVGAASFMYTALKSIVMTSGTQIGAWAFDYCSSLSSVTIPSTVTFIGVSAFKDCTSLKSITLPSSLETLQSNAFQNCTSLQSINLPSTLTTLNSYAFAGCTSLQSINLPSSLTTLNSYTFAGCTSWNNVVIPANITSINSTAFSDCTALTDVTINSASIANPSTAYTTADNLATRFSSVTNLTFGDAVTAIGANAFYYSDNADKTLKSLVIGKNVKTLAETAFNNTGVTEIDIESNTIASKNYSSSKTLLDYFSLGYDIVDLTFGSNVTSIGDYAFDCEDNGRSVYNVYFNGNPDIGYYAFCDADVENIYGTIKNVGERAFYECCIGSSVEIKNATTISDEAFWNAGIYGNVVIGDGVTYIGGYAFDYCSMESIELPSSVKTIRQVAFRNCVRLKTIEIPEDLSYLSSSVFEGCTSLNNVVIPANITSIESDAFSGCSSLTNLTINSDAIANPSKAYTTTGNLRTRFSYVKNLTFGDDVTAIGESAFYGSTTLQSLVIGKNVTDLAETAFTGCYNLTDIDIESNTIASMDCPEARTTMFDYFNQNDINNLVFGCEVTKIGEHAFCGYFNDCQIVNVTFNGNPEIGECAFHTSSVQNISGTVKNVGAAAFYNCYSISEIELKDATSIGSSAFYGCSLLANISLPSTLKTISGSAFEDCISLNNVVLPATVATIGEEAFKNCTGLKMLTCLNPTPVTLTTDKNVFYGVSNCELDVPYSVLSDYKSAEVWKDFYDFFAIEGLKLTDGETYAQTENTDEYPMIRYTRTFPDAIVNKWQCLYVPIDITVTDKLNNDFDFAKLYMVSYKDENGDGEITDSDPLVMIWHRVSVGNTLTHNTPYFVRAKSAGTKKIDIEANGDYPTLYKVSNGTVDCSTTEAKYTLTGIYKTTNIKGNYTLNGSGTFSYYSEDHDLNPYRWYMTITDRNGNESSAKAINIFIDGEDDPTGIAAFSVDSKPTPISVYTIDGRKVENIENLQGGMYIINGKKVYVK